MPLASGPQGSCASAPSGATGSPTPSGATNGPCRAGDLSDGSTLAKWGVSSMGDQPTHVFLEASLVNPAFGPMLAKLGKWIVGISSYPTAGMFGMVAFCTLAP